MNKILEVKNLTFSYKNKNNILKNISFTIGTGEIVGILGANGSGKTTLFEILTGFEKYNEGSILLKGKELSKLKRVEIAKDVSYVMQKNIYNSDFLTVFDYVLEGLRPFSLFGNFSIEDKNKVREIIEKQNLQFLSDRLVKTLSGGEFQRCTLARALVGGCSLVICDEPVSALDLKSQKDFFAEIKSVSSNSYTSFLISLHDINQAVSFCDRIILIDKSEIVYDGKSENISLKLLAQVFNAGLEEIYIDGKRFIKYF